MYHCTIDLLFDWFGLVCFANKNKNSSQAGGQRYSDTSPFSIPWLYNTNFAAAAGNVNAS
jgi:hypothetical protein